MSGNIVVIVLFAALALYMVFQVGMTIVVFAFLLNTWRKDRIAQRAQKKAVRS